MAIQNYGQLQGGELLIYSAAIMDGLEKAMTQAPNDVVYRKIALVKDAVTQVPGENGAMGRVLPKEVLFPISPPTATAELLTGDRTFHPLVRATVRCPINAYGAGYKIKRTDFWADVYGTIRMVPEKLARPAQKLGDILTAQLLRNGKTILDYTGTNFFATGKPLSPSGARTGTFDNLRTGRPLTSINIGLSVGEMNSITNEDGLSMNIMPDTLIIPPNLHSEAVIATRMTTNVFSNGNPAPGQATNTASFAANWIALEGTIKQIIKLPELTQGGASIDRTTWYLAECMNADHGGPVGICFAEEPGVDFFVQMDLSDPTVFWRDEYAWAIQKSAGVAPGLPQFMQRCEA